jgi:protein-S-isoprenylcysteine O-methyltransferase Ste14
MFGAAKPKEFILIADVQSIRKIVLGIATLAGILMFAFTSAASESGTIVHKMIEWTGIIAIVICILGRTWCSMYISGRKLDQFVTVGPYSVSRNPLYFFSILGAAGVGAQLGSVLAGLGFGLLAWIVFLVVISHEERVMTERYGADYGTYKATVPRFMPNYKLWRDLPTLTVMPLKVVRTFADATLFLLAVPLAEVTAHLQSIGVLPVLFCLP